MKSTSNKIRLGVAFCPIGLACLSLLCIGEWTATCGAVEPAVRTFGASSPPPVRSVQERLRRPFNELSRPRYRYRQNHIGWEVRTSTFVVTCTTSKEDAIFTAQEVERTWAKTSKLADPWTNVHHRHSFAAGGIWVFVDDRDMRARVSAQEALPESAGLTMIHLNVDRGAGQPGVRQQLPQLRRSVVQAFFHAGQLDQKLPPWIIYGMADYVARDGQPRAFRNPPARIPLPQHLALRGEPPRRMTADRIESRPIDWELCGIWFEYLLTGDDAHHAPALFTAMRETIESSERWRRSTDGVATPRVFPVSIRPELHRPTAVDALTSKRPLAGQVSEWLKDPEVDQPRVTGVDENNPCEVRRAWEMATVLKLARRFPAVPETKVQPRIIGPATEGGFTDFTPKEKETPPSMEALYRRLTSSETGDWATIDADGSVLLSSDRQRLAQLCGLNDNRYRVTMHDGALMLTETVGHNIVLQGHLEEDTEDARRPFARFGVFAIGGEPKSQTAPDSKAPIAPVPVKQENTPPSKKPSKCPCSKSRSK